MSSPGNRKKPERPQGSPMPSIAYPFATQYQYSIQDGQLMVAFGAFNSWQAGAAMSLHLAIDLHQKLGATIAEVIRQQAAPAAAPASPPNPPPETPNDQPKPKA